MDVLSKTAHPLVSIFNPSNLNLATGDLSTSRVLIPVWEEAQELTSDK